MYDGIIEQDMSPGSNSTKRVGRILTLPFIIIFITLKESFTQKTYIQIFDINETKLYFTHYHNIKSMIKIK